LLLVLVDFRYWCTGDDD